MMAKSVSDQHLSDSVASHAHQNFVRLLVGETVGEALKRVQTSGVEGRIIYFYVVDQQDRLQGVIPTRRLLLNPPETPLADIMVRQVVALPATATLLDACEFFVLHRFLALPVVDPQRRIVGVLDVELYTDEISDLVRREENENVFQLIGVRLGRAPQASVATAFRGRFPWLLCNIGGGLACAAVAALFQHVMADVIVLAMFIPVVLALAESVSIQSLTLAIQAHDSGRFPWRSILRRLRREATIGLAPRAGLRRACRHGGHRLAPGSPPGPGHPGQHRPVDHDRHRVRPLGAVGPAPRGATRAWPPVPSPWR